MTAKKQNGLIESDVEKRLMSYIDKIFDEKDETRPERSMIDILDDFPFEDIAEYVLERDETILSLDSWSDNVPECMIEEYARDTLGMVESEWFIENINCEQLDRICEKYNLIDELDALTEDDAIRFAKDAGYVLKEEVFSRIQDTIDKL